MPVNQGGSALKGIYLGDQLLTGGGGDLQSFAKRTPGASELVAGTWDCGYLGTVTADEFGTFDDGSQAGQTLTGTSLASQVGITTGKLINDEITWHKFARDGEVIFVAEKPIRYNLAWTDIAMADCVFGRNKQSIGGLKYSVTLLRGLSNELTSKTSKAGSEWDDLMISLTDGTFANLNDENLGTTTANGSSNWCQETTDEENTIGGGSTKYVGLYRICRGFKGVAGADSYRASIVGTSIGWRLGWRPALRFTL